MKKIIIFLIMTFALFPGKIIETSTTISAEKSFPAFKVVAVYSGTNNKPIHFENPVTIMEYTAKGFIFNEVKHVKDGKDEYEMPVLDAQGNPVPLNTSDPKYLEKLRLTIINSFGCYTVGNPPQSMIIYVYDQEIKGGYGLIGRNFIKGDLGECGFMKMFTNTSIKHPLGSYTYNDSNMNFELGVYTKKGYEIKTRLSYNPDTLDAELIPGGRQYGYFDSFFGYIWLQPGNKKFLAGGRGGTFYDSKVPQMKNGKLAVPLTFFSNLIYCKDGHEDDTVTIYKLKEHPFRNDCYIKAEFSIKRDTVIVGDKEIKMPFTPYRIDQSYEMIVPLTSFCEALDVKYYWRQFDNSILIERW